MVHNPIKLIQISDTHLFADTEQALLGVNTQQSLQAVLQFLTPMINDVNFIIHSGDLTQDQSVEAYQRLATLFNPLDRPIYCIPGNHDDERVMSRVYPLGNMRYEKHILLPSWQIILLDSHIRDKVPGYLNAAELQHLTYCLTSFPRHYAMIILHHHPVPVGCGWLDPLGLTNSEQFWQLLGDFPKVKAVFFGHAHQEYEGIVHDVPVYGVPSTCIQFMRKQTQFALEKLPPGFRFITLHPDGRIATHIERLSDYIGEFDVTAKGY